MTETIRGVYENGQIKLEKQPLSTEPMEVEVRFIPRASAATGAEPFRLKRGMGKGGDGRMSTWEDFVEVKKSLNPKDPK